MSQKIKKESFHLLLFIIIVYECFSSMYVCVPYMCNAHRS